MVWHTSQSKEKYAVRILESVNKLKEKKILFDCVVKVGEKEIPAHSLLLAANSESLRQEILDGKEKIVFEDVKLEVVEQCMNLMYGQHGEKLEDNMEDILQVSSKIKFDGVTNLCFDYMEENLTVQNCFTIIEHAKSHGRNKVVASVTKFISENLKALIETEKFVLLSKVDLLHYIKISNAECQVVWRAVLKWIEGKEEDGLLLELMNAVNIKEFPIEYLIQTVWKDVKAQDSTRVMVIQCVFSDLELLKRNLNLDNYFLIKSFNESLNTFNKCDVKGIIENFVAEQFSQIKDKDDFMLLNSEDLVDILRDAKLAPVTEKWEAVVKWTKHDTSRAGYFLQLVKMIDVEVFTFNQLLDIVWEESLTQKSEKVKEFVARIIFSKKRELEEHVSIVNCFHLMDVNIKYNSTSCEETDVFLKNFLSKNFGEISQKEEFLLLPKDDVLHILKIAETNGVTNWQAMVRWMKFDVSREDHLVEVMEVVDFEDSIVDFLLQNVYNEPLVQKSEVAKMRAVENILSDVCRLEKSINDDNCLDLKQLVDESSKHDDARKVVNRYMMLNLERVGLERGFLDLNFNGLVSLLQAPEDVIQSDATKWENVLKWVKHEETRDAHIPILIEVLEIQDCSFLLETMWKESVVQYSEEAKTLVISRLLSYVKNLRANTDDPALERIVKTFLANNFSQLRDQDEFVLLNFENLLYILRHSKLAPVTEKWEAAVKWMKHDLSRDGCFIQLVEAIGVESFTFVQLLDIVWEESLTQKSEKVKEFVAKILFSKEREFEKNINITNCFLLMDINMKYNSGNRNETAVILQNFLTVNFGEISKNEDFLLLSIEDVMNSLKIAELEEMTKWEAMIRWMKFDASREDYLLEMMEVVDFGDFTVDFLLQIVYNESLVQKSDIAKLRIMKNLFSDLYRLERGIDENNCLGLKHIVDESLVERHDDARKVVNRYIMLNLERVGLKRGFLDLSFNGLVALLQAPEAVIQSDATKWENVLKWVKHEETRDAHVPILIKVLEIQDCLFLLETMWKESVVQSSEEAKMLVINGLLSYVKNFRANTDDPALERIVKTFLANNFSQLRDKDALVFLNFENLLYILRNPKLAPVTEKWEATLKWMKHDLSRDGFFIQLVEAIGIESFTFVQLLDIVWEESLVQKSEKIKEFVAKILFSKEREFEKNINITNCFLLMDINTKYNSANRNKTTVILQNFLTVSFGEISKNEEFLLLSIKDVMNTLKIAELEEMTKWQAMIRWMKFDASREDDHLLEMMEVVDFGNFTVDFLLQIMYNESLVQKSEVAKMRIVENLFSDLYRLERGIDENNCLGLKHIVDESLAERHDDARMIVNRYMMLNLERVGSKQGFLDLSFNGLVSLLQAPEDVIQSDATKWENVLKWVKHEETRSTHLPRLMEILKIKDFFLQFETVWRENLVQSSAEAKILLINGLFSDLETLRENIDVNNCFHLRELNACDHVNKNEVGKLLSHFMMQHFEEIMGGEDFLNLSEDDLTMFLESPDTKISSEEVKWEAMVKWVKHDKHREAVFSSLFKLLDLKRIDGEYLSSFVFNEPLVKESQEFLSRLVRHLEDRPRCVAIMGEGTSELMTINLEDGSSCSVSISEDESVGIVTIDREVYAVTRTEILQIHKDGTRTVLQQLQNVNMWSKVVSLQKKIYIIQPDKGSMLCFDPADKSFIDDLPGCGLSDGFCAAADDDDFIYAMGGLGTETSARRFDPITRTWSWIPTMRKKRWSGAAATLEGKVYVMGSFCSDDSVECFDPESNSWTEVASMNKPRRGFSAVVIDNRLHAVGGNHTEKENGFYEESIEVYDKQLNHWVIAEKFESRDYLTSACSWPHGSFKPDEFHLRLAEEIEHRIKTKSTKSKIVAPEGGFLDNIGCKVTYPPKTFNKDTKVETSVITDFSDCPDQRIPIAPIIQCSPSGRLNQAAFLELETWAYPTRDDIPVYAEVFQKDEEDSEWTFLKKVRIERNGKISFYAEHFSWFEVVVDCAKWFWSGLTRPFLQVALQNLVYIRGTDQSIACICCLKSDKIQNDITQALRDDGFNSLLPRPVNTHAFRGKEVKVAISCIQPGNLEILPGNNGGDNAGGERRVEKVFSVDDVYKRCEKFHYLPIALRDEDLTTFKGRLRFLYSLAAEDDNVEEHPMQKVWPIPGSAPTHVTNIQRTANFYGRTPINTLLAPDPRENQ